MLKNHGINFDRLKNLGIYHQDFAEYLMGSGLICNDEIKWIVFHGSFDFGYLLRLLTGLMLPNKCEEFFNTLKIYCPLIYDIKTLTLESDNLNGGLNSLANKIGVRELNSCFTI